MFGERRKTGGANFGFAGGRPSTAITPTKRFTDLGTAQSTRKVDNRLSMGQNGGRLSVFQRGSAVAPRDVKSAQASNVTKIYNFLLEHEQSGAPPEKIIRQPTGKNDFITMFEQLYQHLSKDYEFPQGARVEDEFTGIMKGLGYPFPLKNSFFQPMGSSHGYPHLLDALAWLIDVISLNQSVSSVTQNILLGDFMEAAEAQDKIISYSFYSSTFREYTYDRKAIESKDAPFWAETKERLRDYFEKNDEITDLVTSTKQVFEQLRFECEEIEADKGDEQGLLEEIARIKDDVRKAHEYLESTERVQKQTGVELGIVQESLEAKKAEFEAVQAEVNELKRRIEVQRQQHGLTGKEVRQLNVENNRDKEAVHEIQTELDNVSKTLWRMRDEDTFREQKANFVLVIENMEKILLDANVKIGLDALRPPQNEKDLKVGWDALNNQWLPEVNRQLQHKKLELDDEKTQFSSRFAAIEERVQMQQELLREANKKEAREERVRRNERDEWKTDRLQREKRLDELENEKDVLKNQMQTGGSLDREIEEEKAKSAKLVEALEQKKASLAEGIRQKLDETMREITKIDLENATFHAECTDIEKLVLKTRNMNQ
uniref:Kinetochore protein NDC80 n=1 Tax=Caenorhabditis japonica TaxID=281687 RepID=A0A8R1DKN4_CAEJA